MAGEFSVLGVGLPASFFAFLEFLNIIEQIKVIKQINMKKLDFSQEECVLRVFAGPPHLRPHWSTEVFSKRPEFREFKGEP